MYRAGIGIDVIPFLIFLTQIKLKATFAFLISMS